MKLDIYTKAVLTAIAVALTVIACNQYVHPATTAQAEGLFAGVQFSGGDKPGFFDPRTGEVTFFLTSSGEYNGQVQERLKVTKVGSRLKLICGGGKNNDCK
jgi:hypothetical protein